MTASSVLGVSVCRQAELRGGIIHRLGDLVFQVAYPCKRRCSLARLFKWPVQARYPEAVSQDVRACQRRGATFQ